MNNADAAPTRSAATPTSPTSSRRSIPRTAETTSSHPHSVVSSSVLPRLFRPEAVARASSSATASASASARASASASATATARSSSSAAASASATSRASTAETARASASSAARSTSSRPSAGTPATSRPTTAQTSPGACRHSPQHSSTYKESGPGATRITFPFRPRQDQSRVYVCSQELFEPVTKPTEVARLDSLAWRKLGRHFETKRHPTTIVRRGKEYHLKILSTPKIVEHRAADWSLAYWYSLFNNLHSTKEINKVCQPTAPTYKLDLPTPAHIRFANVTRRTDQQPAPPKKHPKFAHKKW